MCRASPRPPAPQADLAISPLKIVGYEGLFGTIVMFCVMLPLVQWLPGQDGQGVHEDSIDTWHVSGGALPSLFAVEGKGFRIWAYLVPECAAVSYQRRVSAAARR